MSEQCPRFGVAKLQRRFRGVLGVGEMVTGEAVTQRVVWPVLDSGAYPRLREIPLVGRHRRTDWPALLGKWCKPRVEIVRDRHQPSLRGLRLLCGDFDEAPVQINRTPIESHDFRCAQAGEHADCHCRENRFGTGFEQGARLFDSENPYRSWRHLRLRGLRDRIAGAVATSSAESEEVVNNPAKVRSGLGPHNKPMEPAIQLLGRDGSSKPASERACESIEPLPQVGKVNSRLALRFPDGEEFLDRRFDRRRMVERFDVREVMLDGVFEADARLSRRSNGAPILGCELAISAPFVQKLDGLFSGKELGTLSSLK